jgi:YVTN family beta-propeller protein
MKRGHYLSAVFIGLLTGILAACGGSSKTSTTVTVTPSAAVVVLGGTQQFSARVSGPSNTAVTWSITSDNCSGSACGTIDANGLYTAPSKIFTPNALTITATSQADSTAKATANVTLDSGVRVQISPTSATVGTGEQIPLTATVTGTADTDVKWTVNGTVNGDATDGLICVLGSSPCQAPTSPVNSVYYLAPAATPPSGQVTVVATSDADSTENYTTTLTVLAAVDPVVASISPSSTAQGAVAQNVYVTAQSPSNFFSTSTVVANGQAVPTTFISTSLIRGQLPAGLLQKAGSVQVAVQAQNGATSNSIGVQVKPQRPAVISFSPVSVPQCPSGSCGAASVTLDGGYFPPSIDVQFNGQSVGSTSKGPNQIAVSLPGSTLQQAGLYQLTVSNSGATPGEAAVNVAVAPDLLANPPSLLTTATVGTQPSAVAIDKATGVAVVANTGSDTISLIDLASCSASACPVSTMPVGHQPTGVAVDPLRDMAIVVNQGDKTLSLVDLSGAKPTQTVTLPSAYTPVSVGENPHTGHALVANQETNTMTVVDLSASPAKVTPVDVTQGGTRSGGTGANPRVTIEPRLDWAIVTPGGNGAISAVDMSHPAISATGQPTYDVVFSFTLSTTVTGAALNPDTDQVLFTDPSGSVASVFSLLDESVQGITNVGFNDVAAAINPLTNIGLLVNQSTSAVQAVDLTNARPIGNPLSVGSSPVGVAIDPVTDEAVVVNQGAGSVSVVSLGGVRTPSIVEASATRLYTSASTQTLTLIGGGFASGAVVRQDGVALPSTNVQFVSSREIKVTIPASLLTGPGLLDLDVQNSGGAPSNIFQVGVVQAISVGTAPVAVALDPTRNMAVVTNSGSNTVSLIDLTTGTVTATINVGANPVAVGVSSRLGTAVVANNGDNSASIVNLSSATASGTSLGGSQYTVSGPIAVDIDQDSGMAAVANQKSNNVSTISALNGGFSSISNVDQGPIGVSVDPNIKMMAVLCSTQAPPTIDILDQQYSPPLLTGHITGANLPTGVTLDPINNLFLVADSSGNRILVLDPQNNKIVQNIATGINPSSIAYNFQAIEAVTVNPASHTASVIEVKPSGSRVRSLLSVDGSSQQSVAIDPITNLAVVADQAHNRVLLVPLPH